MRRKELQEEREERRRQEFRRSILRAAERVVVRRGYGAVTMDDIAHEAQVSKATLYKYFRSKAELPLEILANFFEEIGQGVQRINRLDLSAGERLKRGIHFYLRYNEEKENISRIVMTDRAFTEKVNIFVSDEKGVTSEKDLQFITKMKATRKKILRLVSEILEEGIESEEFRPMDVAAAVLFLESLLQGYCHVRIWHEKPCSAKKAADILCGFFLRGIERKAGPLKGVSS